MIAESWEVVIDWSPKHRQVKIFHTTEALRTYLTQEVFRSDYRHALDFQITIRTDK